MIALWTFIIAQSCFLLALFCVAMAMERPLTREKWLCWVWRYILVSLIVMTIGILIDPVGVQQLQLIMEGV